MDDSANYIYHDIVKDRELLKRGTSYSSSMLDLNELMTKGVLHRGNKVDLSEIILAWIVANCNEESVSEPTMFVPENCQNQTAFFVLYTGIYFNEKNAPSGKTDGAKMGKAITRRQQCHPL